MFAEYTNEKPKVVPSFTSFLKTANEAIQGKTRFGVEMIWLPGKFPNFTLQTHAFKISVSENNPLFKELEIFVQEEPRDGSALRVDVIITDIESGTYRLERAKRQKVKYSKVGSMALKAIEI